MAMPAPPELVRALSAVGLESEVETLTPYASIEIGLVPETREGPLLGTTRIGGMPDVPSGAFEWPVHRWPLAEVAAWPEYALDELRAARENGLVHDEGGDLVMPIPFLAQIDLASVAPLDAAGTLPKTGLLLLFAATTTDTPDPRYAKCVASKVLHVTDVIAPAAARRFTDPAPTGVLRLRPERRPQLDLPWEVRQPLDARLRTPAQKRFVEEATQPRDALLVRAMDEAHQRMPPPDEIAIARLIEHPELSFYVGDAAWITFSIPADALAARDFAAARASVFIG
jgi:hypothetical protein